MSLVQVIDPSECVGNSLSKINNNFKSLQTAVLNGNGTTSVIATGSTTSRTLQDRFADVVNVKDFGAKGDGVTDDTNAFNAAAFACVPTIQDKYAVPGGIPTAPTSTIYVPVGTYNITNYVDNYHKHINWKLESSTKIIGSKDHFLGGVINREGVRIDTSFTYGIRDNANGFSVITNVLEETEAAVTGFTNANQLSSYVSRDSVALYVENHAQIPVTTPTSATYTNTSVSISTPYDITMLRVGMIIDTKADTLQNASKWSGWITSWNSDGTIVYVTCWYKIGSNSVTGTPTNGIGCIINPCTKVWALNANVMVDQPTTLEACGFELGLFNNSVPPPYEGGNKVWGYDAVNLGMHMCESGFTARGPFYKGFEAFDGSLVGFAATDIPISFRHIGNGSVLAAYTTMANTLLSVPFFVINNNGCLELGSIQVPSDTYIDFHSSGYPNDYDCRIISYNGSNIEGNGNLGIAANSVFLGPSIPSVVGYVRPWNDGYTSLGISSNRWSTVYASTGTINTSDARDKQNINDISDNILKAWAKVNFKQYLFNDAVEKKGIDGARIHTGVIVQDIKSAFESEGLDPNKYALFCYDEWESKDVVLDDKGKVIQPAIIAGNRYGVRYDECLVLECAYQRSVTQKLVDRIIALESQSASK